MLWGCLIYNLVGPETPPRGVEAVSQKLIAFIGSLGDAGSAGPRRLPGERQLAKLFQCSRNTVREALVALAAKNIVEIRCRSGVYAKMDADAAVPAIKPAPQELAHAFSALSAVSGALAGSTAVRCSVDDIARLQVITAELGRALLDHNGVALRLHLAIFYSELARICGNLFLSRLLNDVETTFERASAPFAIPEEEAKIFFAEHVKLIQSLERGNEVEASESAALCTRVLSTMIRVEQ